MHELANVRRGYDEWARVYDHDANPLQALEEPVVRAAAGDPRGLRVLDLGCGTGRHALWLAAAGADVTAIDFSAGMLAEARSKAGATPIRFIEHDLHEPLPLDDASFDLVISGLVLEHIRDLGPVFAEIRRILKPQGRGVVSAMHPAMFLRGSHARFTRPETGEIVAPGSRCHTYGEMVLAVLKNHLRLVGVDEYSPDDEFAARFPRAEKYIDWPMLVVLQFETE